VRAVTHPYPGAFTWHQGRRGFVWWARSGPAVQALRPGEVWLAGDGAVWVGTGEGALRLERVEVEGQPEQSAPVWAASGGCHAGEILGKQS